MTDPTPLAVFKTAARYLLIKGWFRDDDDPGEWRDPEAGGGLNSPDYSIGEALDIQLGRDGVNLQTAVTEKQP